MKQMKRKFITALALLACCSAGVGITSVVQAPQQADIVASAETIYNIQRLGPLETSTQTALYVYSVEGDTPSFNSWEYRFTFQADTGVGFLWNGQAYDGWEIKQPGTDFYIGLGKAASVGDVITIGGTFINSEAGVKFIFAENSFRWNGSSWEVYTANAVYTTYHLGEMEVNWPSNNGSGSTRADHLYLKKADNQALPVERWDVLFTLESGEGLKINGVKADMLEMKSTDAGLFIALANVKAGDVVSISGTFTCDVRLTKYTIEESQFVWTGSIWEKYLEYTTYSIGKVVIGQNTHASAVYFDRADGGRFEIIDGAWVEKLTFESGSGIGVTLNGTQISMDDIKIPNNIYVGLGVTAQKGDVLKIGGTFYNKNLSVKYVIEESVFTWNGSAWVSGVVDSFLEVYNVGKVLMSSGSSTAVYFYPEGDASFVKTDSTWTEKLTFKTGSGIGITLNGTAIKMTDIKIPGDMYVGLGKTAKRGDILKIGGTFYNDKLDVEYVISESVFEFNGSKWFAVCDDAELEVYDDLTLMDLGVGTDLTMQGVYDGSGLSYLANEENTTGSVKFRFGYQSTNLGEGDVYIRLRGGAWEGICFRFIWNGIDGVNPSMNKISLRNNQYYNIEIGAIDTKDGANIWVYLRIDGVMQFSTLVAKEGEYAGYNTNRVSLYASNVAKSTISDPDNVSITYTTELGTFTQYAGKNSEYVLSNGKAYDAFIGWVANGQLYDAGEVISIGTSNLAFEALEIDFAMDNGAAIRLAGAADESGIRFTTRIDNAALKALLGQYGIVSYTFGTLIMPYDYLETDQAPNLTDFAVGTEVQQIPCTAWELVDGNAVYYGAMKDLYTGNYDRLFAGRGYAILTFADGTEQIVYTNFDKDENVRSVRFIAQRLQEDTAEYGVLSSTKKTVVDAYAAKDSIQLMDYEAYAANNNLSLVAWYYPELDASNQYNNAHNIAIAQKIKAAGMKAVYLDGKYHLDLITHENIEKTRQIIEFFWSQGLYTIAFGSNGGENCAIDYSVEEYPDFSACEGFMGFLVWDEPSGTANMEKLAEFAKNFEKVYGGTGVTFMANLFPSYASIFQNGSTLDKAAFKAYLQQYCDVVLSQVQGEKWLSLDTYPVNADQSLMENFLFDLGMLKYYALSADAHAHAVLQSSGWGEDGSSKNRMPTEAEMRMQAYAALAFGVDSISWWSYSDKRGDDQQNPTDSEEYYTRFANVNNELAKLGAVYGSFDWKGIILGIGKNNSYIGKDRDYNAYALVKGQIGAYELTVSNTKNLSGVSTDKTNLNYLMGVMEDMSGNEGYMLCNYNSHESDRTQIITLTFKTNVTEAVVYRNGVAQTVSVTGGKLSIELATGEGVFVLPSKLG